MNKIALIGILWASLLFVWCTTTETSEPEVSVAEWKVIVNYSWTFTSVWVWPFITNELKAWEKTLVLRWWSHDVMVHIFIQEEVYKKFFKTEEEYLPWNKIEIVGSITELPWTVGHRYYELKSAQTMKLVAYPDTEEVGEVLTSYGTCQSDDDCSMIWAICPFDCFIWINKRYINIAMDVMWSYVDRQWNNTCMNDCPYAEKAVCRFNSCLVSYWLDDDKLYQEWPSEERIALACPNDLSKCSTESWPVCWADDNNYDSECDACAAWVWIYVVWNCIR